MTQVNFTDKEYAFFKEYADSLGLSIPQMIFESVRECATNDEEDRILFDKAYEKYLADGKQTISFEELVKSLDE